MAKKKTRRPASANKSKKTTPPSADVPRGTPNGLVSSQQTGFGDASADGRAMIEHHGELISQFEASPIIDSAFTAVRSFMHLISGVLLQSDIAVRRDRRYQKMMLHDPDIVGPLHQRSTAAALLEFDIVPEDDEDETQVEQAKKIKQLIQQMRRLREFLRHIQQNAIWYGPAAANIVYGWTRGKDKMIAPIRWIPFHSDTLAFTEFGQLGFRVNPIKYRGMRVITAQGWAHLFDERERRSIVLNTYAPQAPDYDDPAEARYIFAGRGLRDTCWFTWLIKQTIQQLWTRAAERDAYGIRVGRYPMGNADARDEMEKVLRNTLRDTSILLPVGIDNPDLYNIEILEGKSGGNKHKIFADLVEGYLAGQLKEVIIGQTSTTEATSTGIGSGVSDQHAETFGRIVKFDAVNTADALTTDLVHVISEMNFGDTPWRPRWEYALEDVDSKEFMEGVRDFVELGGIVPERQVRSRLGIDEAKDGETVLQKPQDQFGDGFGGDLFGAGNFAKTREDARRAIS